MPDPKVLSMEPNVQIMFVAGFFSKIILLVLAAHNISIDTETAQDLPGVLMILGAYVPDVVSKWRNSKPSA